MLLSTPGCQSVLGKARRRMGRARRAVPFMSFVTRPWGRGDRVIKVREDFALKRMSHDALERPDHVVVFGSDKGKSVSGALGASRAADAMDVGVGGVGHVEVDDMRDAFNIEPAGGDIGGDHDAEMSALEAAQGLLALSLGAVAVQAGDVKTCMRDLPGQLVGTMFGAGKDQHRVAVDLFEQFQE